MKVYIVQENEYDDVLIVGVYSSLSQAMTEHPVPEHAGELKEWTKTEDGYWWNGFIGPMIKKISEFELDETVVWQQVPE